MKRLSVDFSGDALNCVDYIAQELAICRGDALLHAIGLMRFVAKELNSGNRILIVNEKEGYKKQIVQL
ncbi:MAG: hypothetical protein A2941_03330 [Candidatus Yanofskybacteria bacterium RIFCSPLOWO2_01_FULL_49_17]|uniref:Uncharacterized protein n=1 Tax=Candidatus Yanofskybacteria bacterium RIFCSPLOWO2_01_FULL_49_17 TaxID=1802700 RepID=A0A1F8GP47_9BACT|nr:MAG: hypothetical protein A2941_03330 [Candidatus Yanofskybacteria bacterium RIFCSPLOWO2_01_FULL_49_17]